MNRQTAYASGNLRGFLYEFGEAGARIPTHNHTHDGSVHNVICLRGSVVMEELHRVVAAGEPPLDFDGLKDHTIRALEPGSQILNLYLGKVPADFRPDYDGEF